MIGFESLVKTQEACVAARRSSSRILSMLVLLVGCTHEVGPVAIGDKVFGGQAAEDAEFLVAVRLPTGGACSGTYLGGRFVLTAAHCLPVPLGVNELSVHAQSSDGRWTAHADVVAATTTEAWLEGMAESCSLIDVRHDLALLYLDQALEFGGFDSTYTLDQSPDGERRPVPSLQVAATAPERYSEVQVVGLGQDTLDHLPAGRLRAPMSVGEVDAGLLIAVGHAGGAGEEPTGVCPGDSGGAVVQDGQLVAVIAATVGERTAHRCGGTVLYGPTTAAFSSWIATAKSSLIAQPALRGSALPSQTCYDNRAPAPPLYELREKLGALPIAGGVEQELTTTGALSPTGVVVTTIGVRVTHETPGLEVRLEAYSQSGDRVFGTHLRGSSHAYGTDGTAGRLYDASTSAPRLSLPLTWKLFAKSPSGTHDTLTEFSVLMTLTPDEGELAP